MCDPQRPTTTSVVRRPRHLATRCAVTTLRCAAVRSEWLCPSLPATACHPEYQLDPSRMDNPRQIQERFSGAEKIPAPEVAPLGLAAGVDRPEPAAGAVRTEVLIGCGRLDLETEAAMMQAVPPA
jgi:hypothetical protein